MMNPFPRVAVVIVNWNSGEDLEKCLAALEKQTVKPHRVIVIDNASSDDSLSRIEKYLPNIQLIRLKRNIGFAGANNIAVKTVDDCPWVAFLNPDAFADSGWLSNLLETAQGNTEFSFFGSHLVSYDNNDILDGTGDMYHVSGLAWRRDHGVSARNVHRETGEVFAPCAAAAMIRADVFLEAGGFDESFHSYFEDVDLAFRLRLSGHRCLYVSDAVALHVGSGSTHRYSEYAVYHGNRNLVWTFFKNMPASLLWIYLPQHFLANLAAVFWFSFKGQGGTVLRAKWDALKALPRIFRERKLIQKRIKVPICDLKRVMLKGLFLPYSSKKRIR